jgi:hypothetical protein
MIREMLERDVGSMELLESQIRAMGERIYQSWLPVLEYHHRYEAERSFSKVCRACSSCYQMKTEGGRHFDYA